MTTSSAKSFIIDAVRAAIYHLNVDADPVNNLDKAIRILQGDSLVENLHTRFNKGLLPEGDSMVGDKNYEFYKIMDCIKLSGAAERAVKRITNCLYESKFLGPITKIMPADNLKELQTEIFGMILKEFEGYKKQEKVE